MVVLVPLLPRNINNLESGSLSFTTTWLLKESLAFTIRIYFVDNTIPVDSVESGISVIQFSELQVGLRTYSVIQDVNTDIVVAYRELVTLAPGVEITAVKLLILV